MTQLKGNPSGTGVRDRVEVWRSHAPFGADALRHLVARRASHVRSPRWRRLLDMTAQDVSQAVEPRVCGDPVRTQYQMRTALTEARATSVEVREFRAGIDLPALRAIWDAAFSWRPDGTGLMDRSIGAEDGLLSQHEWLLVHESDVGEIDGYCWTKLRPDEPQLGEIYSLAVAPSALGVGLGRQLLRSGLNHLRDLGMQTGVLYVDATNWRAVSLYVTEHFVVHRLEREYGTEPPVVMVEDRVPRD